MKKLFSLICFCILFASTSWAKTEFIKSDKFLCSDGSNLDVARHHHGSFSVLKWQVVALCGEDVLSKDSYFYDSNTHSSYEEAHVDISDCVKEHNVGAGNEFCSKEFSKLNQMNGVVFPSDEGMPPIAQGRFNFCERSEYLVNMVSSSLGKSCDQVTIADLQSIVGLSLYSDFHLDTKVEYLEGDFENFDNLKRLQIMDILSMPKNLFAPLKNLESLYVARFLPGYFSKALFGEKPFLKELRIGEWMYGDSCHDLVIGPNAFSGMYSLEKIKLSGLNVTLPEGVFANNTSVRDFRQSGCKINNLSGNTLSGLSNLKFLRFTYVNMGPILPEDLLIDMHDLRRIDCYTCGIEVLPENIFRNNLELNKISFNRNLLAKLPDKIFHSLYSMDKVSISFHGNQINTISSEVFGPNFKLNNLHMVYLGANPLPTKTKKMLDKQLGDKVKYNRKNID